MSEGHRGAGRYGDDRDLPTEPGASVFGPPAGPPPADRRPYPRTEVHEGLPDAGEPYPPYPAYPDEQPFPGYPDQGSYPDQVHVPAPPPPTMPQPQVPPGPPVRPPGGEGPARRATRRPPRGRPRDDRPARRGPRPDAPFPLGAGALVGVIGLACFLLGLVVLPWFTDGGQEVSLADLRTAFTVPETQPEDLPGANDQEPEPGAGDVPTPGEVGEAVQDEVRDTAAEAAANAIDTGKAWYLELYVERLWIVAAIAVGLAVVFSTILAPRSFALSLILGFRRLSGFVTVLVGAAHGAALWIVFTGDGAPTPDLGVWLGVGGLAAVLIACIIGPRR